MRDWPLALCVPDTLDAVEELEPCDLVYPDYVVENRQVYHSERQEWVYLSEQMPDEAWVFLQADTEPDGGSPGEWYLSSITDCVWWHTMPFFLHYHTDG